MRTFATKITLIKNSRGVYDLDTSKGCSSGMLHNPKGCYNDCYAARYSKKYGYDFSRTILRDFQSETHKFRIINDIRKIKTPFIRMGTSGDPSENWNHTLKIIKAISMDYQLRLFKEDKKQIVIITKHWNNLSEEQLIKFSKFNVIFNTSISALDKPDLFKNRLKQYNILKKYCKSVLRIVSCNFNTKNETGHRLNKIQNELFKNSNVLDNVLRLYTKNEYVLNEVVNIKKIKFLGKNCNVSMNNKDTYIGGCSNCPEMCGLN